MDVSDRTKSESQAWWAHSPAEVAHRLGTDPRDGLTDDEARLRLERHGHNRLPEQPPRPAWRQFLDQFKSVLPLVLIAAALLAGVIGDLGDMAVIAVVVLFNAGLGFYQEHRAERILDALKGMLAHQSRLRRQGNVLRLPSDEVVPGDLLLIEAGDRIPADGRLIQAHSLEIDESTLTGESMAVVKTIDAVADDAALAERGDMVFMNTVVTRGRGEVLVTGTGAGTEIGRLVGMLHAAQPGATPLQEKLDSLGKRLALIAGVVVLVILVMGLWRGEPLVHIVLTAIALAVAAIPEGLPAVVTVTLAVGMYQMTRRGAIVKRLSAVETLGSTTVICSDKTGTLTLNRMTVREIVHAGRHFLVGEDGVTAADGGAAPDTLRDAVDCGLLCNDSRLRDGQVIGDPTEGALVALAECAGQPDRRAELPRLAEIPFESEHKFMATFHAEDGMVRVCMKGAPDVLAGRCDRIMGPHGPVPLNRHALDHEINRLAARALRVLAVAGTHVPTAGFNPEDVQAHANDLVLLALIGIMDPPRPEAKAAIASCREAGIAVKMITGDHRATAAAIARELDLEGEVIVGAELDRMSAQDLAERVDSIAVFARVAPEHKVKIVNALQHNGEVVAMTGDGVNDAAALRAADIGVAMGRTGTDVAREAATMVLTDDDFATIVKAVREGRRIYENIVKFVRFQLSTNVGALLTVLTAPLAGLPVPFDPIQILWVNIIMDGPPAMALAFDPPRQDVMGDPPRPRGEAILTRRRLLRVLTYGGTMAVGTLATYVWALTNHPEAATTLAFTTFVLFQFFNLFNARVGAGSAFQPGLFRNGKLWVAILAVVALQGVAVHWSPAQAVFHTTALTLGEWGAAAAVASSVLLLDEARKLLLRLWRKLNGDQSRGPQSE
ncbi:MAG: cation-transporting P-type ATPase [Alphaproteobacteria bacterium]|nr:cation-transporting P-type ATPase [Alphaproteobacteria bacterium]